MSKEEGGGGERGPSEAGGGQGGGGHQAQYVGPYRLEKTLGKGQTGWCSLRSVESGMLCYITTKEATPLTHSLPNTICWSNRLYSQHQSPPVNLALINKPWNWFLQITTIINMYNDIFADCTLPGALQSLRWNLPWQQGYRFYLGNNNDRVDARVLSPVSPRSVSWSWPRSSSCHRIMSDPGWMSLSFTLSVSFLIEQEYFEKTCRQGC